MLSDDDEWIHDVDEKLKATWPRARPYRARDRLERERQIVQAVEEAVARAQALQTQNAQLTNQLQEKDTEVQTLEGKVDQLTNDLDAATSRADALQAEHARLVLDEGELERLKHQLELLEADLNAAVTRANALQAQNSELRRAENDARAMRQRLDELEGELEEAKQHPKVVVLEDTRPIDVRLQELIRERDYLDNKYQSAKQRYEYSKKQLEFMRSCSHACGIVLFLLLFVVILRLQ